MGGQTKAFSAGLLSMEEDGAMAIGHLTGSNLSQE